jgi:hypothetical protein
MQTYNWCAFAVREGCCLSVAKTTWGTVAPSFASSHSPLRNHGSACGLPAVLSNCTGPDKRAGPRVSWFGLVHIGIRGKELMFISLHIYQSDLSQHLMAKDRVKILIQLS